MKHKKGIEFSFNWLFALIVGAAVIFLAIYAVTQLIGTERERQDTELGKKLGVILTPIETTIEEGKAPPKISMPAETRLYNDCINDRTFGTQEISTATKSGIGKEWQEPGVASSFRNKYLFSSKVVEGKNFYIFSKPFEMPFRIANFIYLWSEKEKFCFVSPPSEIEEEVKELQLKNVNITASKCKNAINVCFLDSDCDIAVFLDNSAGMRGSVKREFQDRVYFDSTPLLYAAIFSSPEIYECQLKRLMKRASELSSLYYAKSGFLSSRGCSSNLESELAIYANQTFYLNSSSELISLSLNSEGIKKKNDALLCKLF